MLLAVDVGNTHTVLGLFRDKQLVKEWRISTDRNKTADEWAVVFEGLFACSNVAWNEIMHVALSSVVPNLTEEINKMCYTYIGVKPLIVTGELKTSVKVCLQYPGEIGGDRIVNVVAAFEKYGGPVIVVDFGTATTFDAVTGKGEYLGGAIAPGISISVEALFYKAARLPKVELIKSPRIIGRNTVESMQSGIMYGFAGQVDRIVSKIKEELGNDTKVVATGGLVELIAPVCEEIDTVDSHLTLEGLRIIYEKAGQGEAVK